MTEKPSAAIILAAGLGKRMRSDLPKVLHPVCGQPMLDCVLDAVERAGIGRVYCITGHKGELVQAHVGARAVCIDQPERLGTGHAVMQAERALADFDGHAIVTCGDTPLLRTETFTRLLDRIRRSGCAGIVLTTLLENPKGYGRIVRGAGEGVRKIVEEKDAAPEERAIREINTGTYCFDARSLFSALKKVGNNNAQGEYYLTDVVEIMLGEGKCFEAVITDDWTEMIGVNSRRDLAEAARHLRGRILSEIMESGVTIVDPATTHIDRSVKVGHDAVIEPFTILRGATAIGEGARIGPNCEIADSIVGARARVRHAVLDGANVPDCAEVGPFAHLETRDT